MLTSNDTVLHSITHTFIHDWNEPSCLYSVGLSIHPVAPLERCSTHPITAHYSFIASKGWKAELA